MLNMTAVDFKKSVIATASFRSMRKKNPKFVVSELNFNPNPTHT
jgi:hypothetical protein